MIKTKIYKHIYKMFRSEQEINAENKKMKVVTFSEAQRLTVPADGLSGSDFFSGLFEKFDDIKKGDQVRIIGKDIYKGHIGMVERMYTTQHNELMFVVELQSNGEMIDRVKTSIRRCYN